LSNPGDSIRSKERRRAQFIQKTIGEIARPAIAVLIALALGALVIYLVGEDPIYAYKQLFYGAFGGWGAFSATLQYTTPLLFTGLAVGFAFRSDVSNIGVEGQMLFGAMAAGLVGYYVHLPMIIHLPLTIIAAMLAGGLWAVFPALGKVKLGLNELVLCMMLNPMASKLTSYLSSYPFKAPGPTNKTYDIMATAVLPQFTPFSQLNAGFILALVTIAVFWFIENRTVRGYELKMVGLNPLFAEQAGIGIDKSIYQVFFISGALAGLAGAEQVLGVYRAYYDGFSPGFGFDGIAVAMLAKNSPIGIAVSALLLGALNSGGIAMQMMTSVTRDIVKVLEAIIILLLAAEFAINWYKVRRNRARQSENRR
jgi:ABC-type uncharacterized transport system permease subunit